MRHRYKCRESFLLFSPETDSRVRRSLRESEDLQCRLCGIGPGEVDSATGLRALLYVGNIGLADDDSGDRDVICSICVWGRFEAGLPLRAPGSRLV
jgi:hypothetical protein